MIAVIVAARLQRTRPRALRRSCGLATLAIAGVFATTGAMAPPAYAGTYTAWSCRNGANASTQGLPDWSHSSSGVGYISTPGVVCQTLPPYTTNQPFGTIVYADGSNNPNLVTDDMSLVAPPDVSLTSARLWWRGEARPTGQVAAIAVRPNGTQTALIDRRNTSFPTTGDPNAGGPSTDTLDLTGASSLTLRSACLSDCQNDPSTSFLASYDAFRVAVSVTDAAAPAGRSSGELLTDAVLKGQRSVTIDATDKGGGVYLARVVSDGQVVASSGVDDPTCRDADATNNDPFEFSAIRPCPASATTTVTLDTTTLGEDLHHDIQVQVVDAAGNTTVLAERTVGVDNQPPAPGFFDRATRRFQNPLFDIAATRQLNGAGATPDARVRVYLPVRRTVRVKHGAHKGQRRRVTRAGAKRTVTFSSRATLRARLSTSAGQPISGAQVWTASRVEGSDWQITGRPHTTGKTGRVGFRLRARGPSRELNLVYFPYSDSHEQVVGRPIKLNVRCGVRLSVDRHDVRNGQRVRFAGGLEAPLPRRGATASLQVKLGRRYHTFRQVRLRRSSDGRFRTSYRFTATARPTRYRFRLLVLKQAGLPYERGTSTTQTVTVIP
jgi:hypothetical protein